jgi:segregation and condensation protein B
VSETRTQTSPLSIAPDALFEALLFASPQPVTLEQLAETAGLSVEDAEAVLAELEERLADRGLRLQRSSSHGSTQGQNQGKLQLVTAAEAASYVEDLLNLEVNLRLSQAALETLSIVAYAQPITRPQIEAIRGVNSDHVLRTLVSTGLVENMGRAETLGRPILYGTTFEFLQQFGLEKIEDLPPIKPPDAKTTEIPPGA